MLTPLLVTCLIAEDQSCGVPDAFEILKKSAHYGQMLFPSDDSTDLAAANSSSLEPIVIQPSTTVTVVPPTREELIKTYLTDPTKWTTPLAVVLREHGITNPDN